jgi:hypothetical protein
MSDIEGGTRSAPHGTHAKQGFWRRLKHVLRSTETNFDFFKHLTFIGFLATLIVSYFQFVSSYRDKVATVAKGDLAAATSAFTEALNTLSIPISLQDRIITDYYGAVSENLDTDDNAYVTMSAPALYKSYTDSYTTLRDNYDLLARKMELYLDWALDPARQTFFVSHDPLSVTFLGTHNFDCDRDMPSFSRGTSTLRLQNGIIVDWYSAKHNLVTIEYCFELTNQEMVPVHQWASKNRVDQTLKTQFTNRATQVVSRLNNQILRLNAFETVAKNEIEQYRSRYVLPHGFFCNMPFVICH